MNIKDQVRREIDSRREHLVTELTGHREDNHYHWLKGMHDAYVDLLTYLDNSVPDSEVDIAEEAFQNGFAQGLKLAAEDYKHMPYTQFFDKIHTIEWLQDIANDYKGHIELMDREVDHYTVQGISFTARGDGQWLRINPHRPIPATEIRKALTQAVASIEEEIAAKKEELQNIVVDV